MNASPDLTAKPARRLATDVAAQIAGSGLNAVLGIVATAALARGLGPDGFGEWMTLAVLLQIAAFACDFGVEGVVVRLAARAPSEERRWLGTGMIVAGSASGVTIVVAAIAVVLVARSSEMKTAGLVLLLSLALAVPGVVSNAVLQLRVRNHVTTAAYTLNSVLWTTAVLVVATGPDQLVGLAVSFIAIAALTAALTFGVAVRDVRPQIEFVKASARRLLALALPVGLIGLLAVATTRVDQILVFARLGTEDAATYGAALRLFVQASILPTAIMTTLFPVLASIPASDSERLRTQASNAARILVIAAVPVAVGGIVFGDQVVGVIFGDRYNTGTLVMPLLMLAFIPLSVSYLLNPLALVVGVQNKLLVISGGVLALNVTLNVLLLPRFGVEFAAGVMLATQALLVILGLVTIEKRLSSKLSAVRPGATVASAVLAGAVAWLARKVGAPLGLNLVLLTATYGAALVGTGTIALAEVRALLPVARRA